MQTPKGPNLLHLRKGDKCIIYDEKSSLKIVEAEVLRCSSLKVTIVDNPNLPSISYSPGEVFPFQKRSTDFLEHMLIVNYNVGKLQLQKLNKKIKEDSDD